MIKFYRNEETKAIVVALQGEACPGMKELEPIRQMQLKKNMFR